MRTRPLCACLALIFLCACAHGGNATPARPKAVTAKPIPEAEYPAQARRFQQMALDDPDRTPLRDRLIASILLEARGRAEIGDYEGVVAQVERITAFLSPADFAPGRPPAELEPLARYIATEANRLGDEGRALGANLLLARITQEEDYESEYQAIASWSREARSHVPNVLQRYGELIDVWSNHAALTPAPSVLDTLAELHVARRDAIVGETDEFRNRFGVATNRIWRIAPLDVAAVYLAHGDVSSAITHVDAMGPGGELQLRLLDLLRRAKKTDADGADATFELVEGFRVARPEVASGLCQSAMRRYPEDYRFPACMARVASEAGDFSDAAAWYLVAIGLAPTLIELYDEALTQLDEFIEARLLDPHPERSSALAQSAEAILRARQDRWPNSEPPIAPDRLQYLIGMLEMNAGQADDALKRFEASIDVEENAAALLQLGLLLERTGQPAAAERRFARALALTPTNTRADALRRAEILEHLGNASLAQGKTDQASQRYKKALDAWTKERENVEGPSAALVELRRGVLLDSLGEHDQAIEAFQSAMAAAPQWREVYASILSHIVVSEPDFDFASQVWRRAQLQLNLPPEWKVYFTLWMQLIAGRAGQPASKEHTDVLRRLSQSSTWWGKLASFGAREIDYSELLSAVSNLGEETEAHFYEGTRLFAAGDNVGAEAQLRRVLDTRMVSFYEYEMARKLLRADAKNTPQP